MNHFRQRNHKLHSETGQGFVEYALILIFVGIAVVAVVALMQPAIGDVFSRFVAQAPVAPPALLNYTPPPTFTSTPTVDPLASPTPIPSITLVPSQTPTPTNTTAPSSTPTATSTATATATVPCAYPVHNLPANGSVRVQMENFRCGGAGVAFLEAASDGGPGSSAYRSDVGAAGPDLETTTDSGGGNNLAWVGNGEWLEYEVTAPQTLGYTFLIRNASISTSNPRIRVTVSQGQIEYVSDIYTLGPTNGWQNWADDIIGPITLFAGSNTVRITMETGGANYNYFEIHTYTPTATPTPATPTATPIPTNTPTATPIPTPVVVTYTSNSGQDGDVLESSSNSSVGGTVNTTRTTIYIGDDNGRRQYIGFLSFDTSAIPDNATILSVELRLRRETEPGTPFNTLDALYADIGPLNGFSGNTTLQAGDFQVAAAANNVMNFDRPANDGDWTAAQLGAGNFGRVNLTGYTQFRLQFESPDDGDGTNDQLRIYSGNSGTPGNRPQLIITYTVP